MSGVNGLNNMIAPILEARRVKIILNGRRGIGSRHFFK
jgi:hypothetical protein